MSRVSVTACKKPKPKNVFKFLRRDEGRLSYSQAAAEEPTRSAESLSSVPNRERRDSKALREAIAFDMRNVKSHDPLGEVVVAIPKKAPPPNQSATDDHRGPSKRHPRVQSKARPEWVDPEVPTRPAEQEVEKAVAAPSRRDPSSKPHDVDRSVEYDLPYRGLSVNGDYDMSPMRRTTSGLRRYTDTADHENYDRNFFRCPPQRDYGPTPRSRDEDDLMLRLEQEVRAAQEERSRYMYAKQLLDRDKQRFETYKFDVQQQMDDNRADLEARRSKEQRENQQSVKSIEERYKNVSQLLATERETNRRLVQENETLRTQLDDLTATLRESQRTNKSEVARLRRDIESLQRRNTDLLEMAKENQRQQLCGTAAATPLALRDCSPSLVSKRSSPPRDSPTSTSEDHSKIVMDFTPRSNDPARERRAREVEERMRREEEEMHQRREQREREAERRRAEDAAEAQRLQEAEAAKQRDAAACRKKAEEEDRVRATVAEAERAAAKDKDEAARKVAENLAAERKGAGHPMKTPRVSTAVERRDNRTNNGNTSKKPPTQLPCIPTKEELLAELEAAPEEAPDDEIVSQTPLGEERKRREVLYRSGKREIQYVNGTIKVVLPTSHTVLRFTNGDVKVTFPSGASSYWYDAAQTTHTQLPDGVQVFEFHTTGQIERHLPNGVKQILYNDGSYKLVNPDGTEETLFPEDQ